MTIAELKHALTRFAISVISQTEFLEGFNSTVEGERLLPKAAPLFSWLPLCANELHRGEQIPVRFANGQAGAMMSGSTVSKGEIVSPDFPNLKEDLMTYPGA